jgi:hypothetical protein
MEEKLTPWEIKYTEINLPEKLKSDFYYDNPGSAYEDIEFLLILIKKLKNS